jgi:hypothetical protein
MEATNEKSEKGAKTPEDISSQEGSTVGRTQSSSDYVPFEAYLHFAALQRSEEAHSGSSNLNDGRFNTWLSGLSSHKGANVNIDASPHLESHRVIPLSEKENASRALRLASWSSVFYLITVWIPLVSADIPLIPIEDGHSGAVQCSICYLAGRMGPWVCFSCETVHPD